MDINNTWTATYNDNNCTAGNISIDPECITSSNQPDPVIDFSIFHTWIKAINTCIGLLGISGNALVILVIITSARMRSNYTNYFILNHSIIDFGAGLFLIIQSLIENDGRRFFTLADDLYCRLWLPKFPLWSTLIGSTYSLIALTIDRYLAVVHPIWHRNYFRRWQILALLIITSWLCGIVSMLVYMLPSSGIENGNCFLMYYWSSENAQKIWGIAFIVYQFILPMAIHIYCYVRIARVILKTTNFLVQPVTNNPTASSAATRSGRNVIKTLGVVTLCFFCCWATNQTMWLGFQIGFLQVDTNGIFYNFSVFLVFCNCCVNPFIYVTNYTQFQKAMRSLFRPGSLQPGNSELT